MVPPSAAPASARGNVATAPRARILRREIDRVDWLWRMHGLQRMSLHCAKQQSPCQMWRRGPSSRERPDMAQTGFSRPFPSLACHRLFGAVIVIGATHIRFVAMFEAGSGGLLGLSCLGAGAAVRRAAGGM